MLNIEVSMFYQCYIYIDSFILIINVAANVEITFSYNMLKDNETLQCWILKCEYFFNVESTFRDIDATIAMLQFNIFEILIQHSCAARFRTDGWFTGPTM